MAKLSSAQDLAKKKKELQQPRNNWVKVGMSSCGLAAGAQEVYDTLVEESRKRNMQIQIQKCGCQGMCYAEPLVEVSVEGLPVVVYGRVNRETAVKILDKHVAGKMLVNDSVFDLNT
ncbi:MAG: (2Fe-2S) ferredoxin domain-containing protein [Candidatus Omnitrophota bacterium]|jgi:(2Fe-2S) ferredoxin